MSVLAITSALFVCLATAAVSAIVCRRGGIKVFSLSVVALILFSAWYLAVMVMADLSAHSRPEDVVTWPTPMVLALIGLLIFTALSCAAIVRRPH